MIAAMDDSVARAQAGSRSSPLNGTGRCGFNEAMVRLRLPARCGCGRDRAGSIDQPHSDCPTLGIAPFFEVFN